MKIFKYIIFSNTKLIQLIKRKILSHKPLINNKLQANRFKNHIALFSIFLLLSAIHNKINNQLFVTNILNKNIKLPIITLAIYFPLVRTKQHSCNKKRQLFSHLPFNQIVD